MCFTINLVGMNSPVAAAPCIAISLFAASLSTRSDIGSVGVIETHPVFDSMVTVVATFANRCLLNQRHHAFLMRQRADEQMRQIADQRELDERLASADLLTDYPNRRRLDALISSDLMKTAPHMLLAVAMIDSDCFRAFNDGYGNPDGDAALRIVAGALRKTCRDRGRSGRLGDEEFDLMLIGIASEDLAAVGEELGRAVEACALAHRWSAVAPVVKTSVGLADGRVRQGQ